MNKSAFISKIRKKTWTIKIVSSIQKEISVLHVNALDLLRLACTGALIITVTFGYFFIRRGQEIYALGMMKNTLHERDNQLKSVEKQKIQVENLLDQKASLLESHLNSLKKQENEIRRLLPHGRVPDQTSMRPNLVAYAGGSPYFRYGRKSARAGYYSNIVARLPRLENEINLETRRLKIIQSAALTEHRRMENEKEKLLAVFDRIPTQWPVLGTITSGYGYRAYPDHEFHEGLDIGAGYATPIHAAGAGKVVESGYDYGYGLTVKIDHGNGIISQYSHCSRVLVSQGETVGKGEVIARVGCTGFCTGPHVHFQVFDRGTIVNPMNYLGLTVDELAAREATGGN